MKTTRDFKRFIAELTISVFLVTTLNPLPALAVASNSSDKIIYPLKEISKLECRFQNFNDLSSNCKQDLPTLKTKDYKKYASQNWGYNDFTRLYTMLWWTSYKYGWDVWNGGHIWTDIATAKGTPVYNMADWKVINAKSDPMLWKHISIEHNIKGKKIISNYLHLSKINVKKWDIIKVGAKIWEVWSTWNSTWNHLHFQIDLPSTFYPYYYDYNKCSYSYYQITEQWVCIDELSKNTIDPLLFLETAWAVLDNFSTRTIVRNSNNNWLDLSIFNRTVYIWYSKTDIKKVQEIYKKMGVYKGRISWDYRDLEKSVIAYQLSTWVIKTKTETGAGWFGPKTRYQTKKDYLKILDNWKQITITETRYETKTQTKKIAKANLMSREEIEKREVDNFLKYYNIELNFVKEWWNIKKDTSEVLKLKITNKKGKPFKWEMPWGMTFSINKDIATVFPERLFYFTDWKRDIIISGLKEGNTKLYIKIGNQTIKTINLKIFKAGKTLYPETSTIISPSRITLWDKQTWIVLFKDQSGRNMINLKYWSTYKIKASKDNKICIKEGSIKNIRKIYKSDCKDEDYKNEFDYTYNNTVWWLLIFDYKASNKDFSVKITNTYNNKVLSEKKVLVSNPKWLKKTYAYTNEVIDMLKEWVVDWINKWYFLENRWLKERDAYTWISNALTKINKNAYDQETKNKAQENLTTIKKILPYISRTKILTRNDFLDLNHKYLVLDKTTNRRVEYKDIDNDTSIKLANIFDNETTWKDKFGESYFRPNEKITRWEWAYFISQTLNKNAKAYLTLK